MNIFPKTGCLPFPTVRMFAETYYTDIVLLFAKMKTIFAARVKYALRLGQYKINRGWICGDIKFPNIWMLFCISVYPMFVLISGL